MKRSVGPALLVALLGFALTGAGCSMFGRGGALVGPSATASTDTTSAPDTQQSAASEAEQVALAAPEPGQVDIRRFIGPDYCPEMRILNGAEVLRRYEGGRDGDPAAIVWQASFSETARDCLYDQQGNLTIKMGVSGRVIAGPKGGPGDVTVPVKVAVVKFKEAALAIEDYPLAVTIPPVGSTTFAEVREIVVPSPGRSRNYVLYVGFDVGEWDLEAGQVAEPPVAAAPRVVDEPPPLPIDDEPVAAAPPPPPKKKAPDVLPTPSGGFVLPR